MTNKERLQHACPKCNAKPGDGCRHYNGEPTDRPHKVRGPGQLDAHLAAEAERRAARQRASYGPLFQSIAEQEVQVEALDAMKWRKRFEAARGVEQDIGLVRPANRAIVWVRLWGIYHGMVRLVGQDAADRIWGRQMRVYGDKPSYIEIHLRNALTTTKREELRYELRFDPARINASNSDGRHLVCVDVWEPAAAVMTPAEYDAAFPPLDHVNGVPCDDEPDDGGLFDRIMSILTSGAK